MKSRFASRLAACLSLPLVVACSDGSEPSGTNVEISVAPLTLPAVVGVSYKLTVYNGQPVFNASGTQTAAVGTVWTKDPVTSGTYGNGAGGDITYIGPCDANTPLGGDQWNYVALVLNQIQVPNNEGSLGANLEFLDDQFSSLPTATPAGDGDADFENPCPTVAPCVLKFKCKENADVPVEFNLTIMRDANQGFFDIAVNFEDVFCSAKLDTCYADPDGTGPKTAEAIKLLFGTNGREETAVAAFACTAGPDTAAQLIATRLLMTKPKVKCGATEFDLPLDVNPGTGKTVTAAGKTLQYGIFSGEEQLNCGSKASTTQATDTSGRPLYGSEGQYYAVFTNGKWALKDAANVELAAVDGTAETTPVRFSFSGGQGVTIIAERYFKPEPLSCNKVYFNLAVDIAQLKNQGLGSCEFFWVGTAVEAADTTTFASGALADSAGLYGAVRFGNATQGVPLTTGAAGLVCDANPLGGKNFSGAASAVQSVYLGGADYLGGGFVTGVTFNYKFDAPANPTAP